MFSAEVKIKKSEWVACNMYYLKKYIGIRESLLLLFLFIAGIVLGIIAQNLFVLIMCGVTVLLAIVCIAIYYITGLSGYKQEFEKRGAIKWNISFNELGITADVYEEDGATKYTDKKLYEELDRVALLKDRVYIYFNAALMFYIKHSDFVEGNFIEFCDFLKERVDAKKFKMKAKFKFYKEVK
ncbi:MAG: hypothetical protein LBF12_06740 [Christensenellaceae bacterium]|jgi:hypothetical protein|nr:hypothetical protein [Christensenellaceae bacterium]